MIRRETDDYRSLFLKLGGDLLNRHPDSCREIPSVFCREIICDWAFSKGQVRVLARKSYDNWGRSFRMHPATRQWILEFLEIEGRESNIWHNRL